jgi:hypothetical protein
MPEVEQFIRGRSFHQGLELLLRQGAEEAVVDLRPPLRTSIEPGVMGRVQF